MVPEDPDECMMRSGLSRSMFIIQSSIVAHFETSTVERSKVQSFDRNLLISTNRPFSRSEGGYDLYIVCSKRSGTMALSSSIPAIS